jgi:hypothetical protein
MEDQSMVEVADIKIAVLQVALGIKSLEDKELFDKLEEFWISAYKRGRDDASDLPARIAAARRRDGVAADSGGGEHG